MSDDVVIDSVFEEERRDITIGGFGFEETLKERRIHEGAKAEVCLRSRDPTTM